jgi:hypothetical protein
MAHDWFSIVKDSYFIMLYFLIFSAMHASLEKKINYFKVRNSILKKKKTRISYKKIVMAWIKAWILKSKIYNPKHYRGGIEKIFDILLKT